MRIIYLHQYFHSSTDAGATRSLDFAKSWIESGHSVDMITTDQNAKKFGFKWQKSIVEGITVYKIPIPYSNHMGFAARILAFLTFSVASTLKVLTLKGELIFATSTPLTIAIPAIIGSRLKRIPMVFEVRDLWPEFPIAIGFLKNKFIILLAKLLAKSAYSQSSLIVTLSDGMARGIEQYDIPTEKIMIIPQGANAKDFQIDLGGGPNFRKKYGIPTNRPMVVFCGTLGFLSDVEFILDLAGEMQRVDPEVCFVIIGDGKNKPAAVRRVDSSETLKNNVIFLQEIPRNEVPKALSGADMALATIANFPEIRACSAQNKVYDALAAGTPIAINYTGPLTDFIVAEDIGICITADNLSGSASLLAKTLRNSKWMNQAGNRCRFLAENNFDRHSLAKNLETEFFKLVG